MRAVLTYPQSAKPADGKGRSMFDIWSGMQAAFWLVVTLDADLLEITLRSLQVSVTALFIASLIALPFGTWLAVRRFRYRRATIAVLNALMGLPPVVVGLIVYLLLSRSGPFGVLGLLFTPTAMIIAQIIIITPSSRPSPIRPCASFGQNITTF